MKRLTIFPRFILVLTLLISLMQAQEDNTQIEAEVLSFEELMNIVVVTASKEEQNISDAPAIIDVITSRDIKNFNATNLYELLSYLPGIEMMETYFGRTVLNFRGIQNIHYSNKVLMMLNGNPVYEPVNGSYFLEQLPVSAIERIEVIRGPGSALYGTNAYSGVINIITGNNGKKAGVSISGGSFNTVEGEAFGTLEFNEEASLFVAARYKTTDGYEFNVENDEAGNSGTLDYFNKPMNLFASFKYNKFNLDFTYMKLEKSLYGITPNLNYSGEQEFNNFAVNGKYQFDINEKVSSSLFIRYNNYEMPNTSIGYFPFKGFGGHEESTVHLETKANWFGAEIQFNSRLSETLTNISGVVYETYKTEPYYWKWDSDGTNHPFSAYLDEYTANNIAGYSQFTLRATEKLSLLAGFRIVKDKDIEDVFFLPRAGLIYKFAEERALKLLYGQAFRSPSLFEKYVSTQGVLFGSKNLDAEKIHTVDLGYEAAFKSGFKGRVNAFYTTTSDGITRVPTSQPDVQGANAAVYANASKLEFYGLEVSANGIYQERNYWGANFSWKTGKNSDTDDDLKGFAAVTANCWLVHNFGKLKVTPQLQFIGEREGTSSRVGDYTVDSYLLANLTLSYKIKNIILQVSGKNLFDKDYVYPEYIRSGSEEVPGGPGISYFATLRYEY